MVLRRSSADSKQRTHAAQGAPSPAFVRIWPPVLSCVACVVLVVGGLLGMLVALANGYWIAAALCALLPLPGAALIGWVEIDNGMLRHRHLVGDSTSVPFALVREVGLGMHQVRGKKFWYPEIETADGKSVKFLSLRSLSGKATIARVETIFATGMAAMPKTPEDEFTTKTTSGDLEFFLTPGYDAYLRDKAEDESVERLTGHVSEQLSTPDSFGKPQAPEPVHPAQLARHLSLVEAAPPIGQSATDDDETTVDVFTPAPLVLAPTREVDWREFQPGQTNAQSPPASEAAPVVADRETQSREQRPKSLRHLAAVRSAPSPEEPSPAPTTSATPPLIPVVIETPNSKPEPDRQFTSLFKRAA